MTILMTHNKDDLRELMVEWNQNTDKMISRFMGDFDSKLKAHIAIQNERSENIQDTLVRIEGQTIKTNGRVSKLENFKAWILGGLGVVGILMAVISWIYVAQQSTQDGQIENIIKQLNHIS